MKFDTGLQYKCESIVKLEQHLNELIADPRYEYHEDKAEEPIEFIERHIKHWKAPFDGKPLLLEEHQKMMIRAVFGIYHKGEDRRLIKTLFYFIPRKNGKTSCLAAIMLYIILMEGKGLEGYTGASKLKQAKIAFNDVCKYVQASKVISQVGTVWNDRIDFSRLNSVIRPLAAEGKTASGLNTSVGFLDEIHEMSDKNLIDVIETSMSSRKNPLMLMATTAGSKKWGPAWDLYEYSKGILNKTIDDNSFLPVIFEVDEGIDLQSDLAIKMANPNLNVSTMMDQIQIHQNAANQAKYKQANYQRMYLNRWVATEGERWLAEDRWASFAIQSYDFHREFAGQPVWLGLDIGPKLDMTCLASISMNKNNNNLHLHVDYFVPEEQVQIRVQEDKVPYDRWVDDGYLNTTPGNTIDSQYIIAFIIDHCSKYQVQHLGYDPAFSFDIFPSLSEEKITISEIKQNLDTLTYPCNFLEKHYTDGTIVHGNHPILAWNTKNAKIFISFDGRKKLTKDYKSSKNRIDGLSAILCAIEAMRRDKLPKEQKSKDISEYTNEDIAALSSVRSLFGF